MDDKTTPEGDIKAETRRNMEEFSETYKNSEALDEDIRKLEKFGHVSNRTGIFLFNRCRKCSGPLLGHIATESECEAEHAIEMVDEIMEMMKKREMFECMLAFLDKRTAATKCSQCGETFSNRMNLENHCKKTHAVKEVERDNTQKDNDELMETIVGAIDKLTTASVAGKTTQITKAKQPPLWIGQTFERFKKEVENWSSTNKDHASVKYSDLMESLKKNDKVKEYVCKTMIETLNQSGEMTVEKILELL